MYLHTRPQMPSVARRPLGHASPTFCNRTLQRRGSHRPLVQSAETLSLDVRTKQAAEPAAAEVPSVIVDKVLELIKDSDAGLAMNREQQDIVNELLAKLEEVGKQQQPPLENPLLWGNYVVAYTSNGRDQTGEAAGGRFRSTIGRNLFKTTGLFQSVLKPDLATNKVSFKLFGFIPGFVGLRGKVLPLPGRPEWVQVDFEPPVLSLADKLVLRIGPPSDVTLATTYLDERIRLGKGSRGSLFVFTRGGEADKAGMSEVGLQSSSLAAALVATAGFVSIFLAGGLLWWTGHPLAKAGAVALWMVGSLIGAVVRRGGIVLTRGSSLPPEPQQAASSA